MDIVKIKWRYENLVQAAPDLYDALEELYVVDLLPRDAKHGRLWQNALKKADKALKKARGEK